MKYETHFLINSMLKDEIEEKKKENNLSQVVKPAIRIIRLR
jgi:hypothetical protein